MSTLAILERATDLAVLRDPITPDFAGPRDGSSKAHAIRVCAGVLWLRAIHAYQQAFWVRRIQSKS